MNLKKIMLKKPGTESMCCMVPFMWLAEQVLVMEIGTVVVSGCVEGIDCKSKRELSGGNALYLDWSDSYTGA